MPFFRVLLGFAFAGALTANSLVPPLTPPQAQEARRIIEEFKKSPKGPFQQILWFCKDGTTRTPKEGSCKDNGGGVQYATRNAQAKKLSGWNIDVGTIFASMAFEEFFDLPRNHHRLRQFALEQYLRQIDDDWVDRRAFSYRGSRQIEDETAAGQTLLAQMLSNSAWVRENFFLALQTVSAVPHGAETSVVKQIRALATAVADADARFQPLRAKIHSAPGAADLDRVKAFRPNSAATAEWKELVTALENEQKTDGLTPLLDKLSKQPVGPDAKALADAIRAKRPDALMLAGPLSLRLRESIESSANGKQNLALADVLLALSDWTFQNDHAARASRTELLARANALVQIATATGLLSDRQRNAHKIFTSSSYY